MTGLRRSASRTAASRRLRHVSMERPRPKSTPRGNLVTESYVNPHLHLCKVWTLPMMEEEALKAYQGRRHGQSACPASSSPARSRKNMPSPGSWRMPAAPSRWRPCTATFTSAPSPTSTARRALRASRRSSACATSSAASSIVQVVAFAQDGMVREPGAAELMHQAMALGADVVGGIPWIEFTNADAAAHVRTCFDLAQEFGKDVSMLLDDAGDPDLRTLEMMAVEAIRARLARPRAGASLPGDEPLPDAVRAASRARSADRRRCGRDRSAYRSAARARQGIACGGCSRLPRPGRHFRRLLSIRPQQYAGSGLSRFAPVVDDDAARGRQALRHDHHGSGQSDQSRRFRLVGRRAGEPGRAGPAG